MKLAERISSQNLPAAPSSTALAKPPARRLRDPRADGLRQLKLAVHNRLFETLDVARLESLEAGVAAAKVTQAIGELLDHDGHLLTDADRVQLIEEIRNELLGLGPLEPLLRDAEISDILVNGPHQVYVERRGKLYPTSVRFNDDQHLMLIIERIVSQVGRRVDESSPMVDAR
ncbi:MAG: ATPase, T2SS/T4P/T4SS family, partial [Candidatus Binataceae bacterium]